jgi:hypothetical protein
MKLKDNVTLQVVMAEGEGYRVGTTKSRLLTMSKEAGTFTKLEWLAKASELYDNGEIAESAIANRSGTIGWAKAWFNEFYNKHHIFQPVDSE